MARIFPDRLSTEYRQNHNSPAELKLFDCLKANLSAEFTVFYNRTWINRNSEGKVEQGEADFVIVHPTSGILILEVKGGRIEIDGFTDSIYSIDHMGRRHQITDPWKQAEKSKFILLNKIRSLPKWKDRWVDIGSAVAFCDLFDNKNLNLGIQRPKELIIFKDDLESNKIQDKIESIYQFWSKKKTFGIDGINLLEKMLAPTLKIENPLKRDLETNEKELIELKDQQFELLEMISQNQRVLVQGGAGTGKTVLLLEKAKRFVNDNLNTLIICFSPTLRDFLRKSVDSHPNLQITSFDQLVQEFANEKGILNPFKDRNPFSLTYQEKKQLSDLLLDCIETSKRRFEAILVDEGQDFHSDWWVSMELLLSETEEKYFYIFYDKSQIVDNKNVIFPTYMTNYSLTQNIRNSDEIHQVASSFYSGTAMKSSGVKGAGVIYSELTNENDLQKRLISILNQHLTVEKISLDQIGILMPEPIEEIYLSGKTVGEYKIINAQDRKTERNQILVESISKFKGLERPIIILCNLEKILKPGNLNISELYVGLSRPKSKLIIIGNQKTLSFIQSKSRK
ncbi:MAG: NERD domain-containing protein [Leptospira sp.]|nr:NERD domain-containing protein [Leptospira sp.]